MFWVPAVAGGIFGLLGGYLTDIFGRRRILTWSILLYAFSAFASGYSTSLTMLLVLRSTTFVGVCVEFVAAVAWMAELFDDHAQRERRLGLHAGVFIVRRIVGRRGLRSLQCERQDVSRDSAARVFFRRSAPSPTRTLRGGTR